MTLNQLYIRLQNIEDKIADNTYVADKLAFVAKGSNPEISFEDLQGEYLELSKEKTDLLVLAERALLSNLVDIEDANDGEAKRVTLKEVKLTLDANIAFISRLKRVRNDYYDSFSNEPINDVEIEPNFDPSVLNETISAVEDRIEYLTNVFQMASVQIDVGE